MHSCLDESWPVADRVLWSDLKWFPPGSPCSKHSFLFPRYWKKKGQEKGWQKTRVGLEQNGKAGEGCLLPPMEDYPSPHSSIVTPQLAGSPSRQARKKQQFTNVALGPL